jgi:hypothetical protein
MRMGKRKEKCGMIVRMHGALKLLMIMSLALSMAACAWTSASKMDDDRTLVREGGATNRDKGVDVVTSNSRDDHSLDAADGNPKDALYVGNNGNVGIGTVTPSDRLSVNGTIESGSGGFKFPDGTIQKTAAITNYQRITRWKAGGVITFQPGQSKSVVAPCPKGTKALGGGGGFHKHSGPIAIIASHSRLKGTQWIVVFKNLGTEKGFADLFSEVICVTMD